MVKSRDNAQKRKKSADMETSRKNDQKRSIYKQHFAAPKSFYLSFSKNKSLLSATSILSPQPKPMAHNCTASMNKPSCTDNVDFGKCQDRFGRFSWSKNDTNYVVVKKVFTNDDNKNFRLVQNLTMRESDFNQFNGLRNQLVIATDNLGGEQNLSPLQIPRRCGSSHAWLFALQCGQAREFRCSSPILCKKEKEISTNCLCELNLMNSYI